MNSIVLRGKEIAMVKKSQVYNSKEYWLNHLELDNMNIHDFSEIKGLDQLTDLESLRLWHNQIINLKGLENLKNLCYIYLNNNNITEIKDFKDLDKLEEVDLTSNQISSIDGIEAKYGCRVSLEGNPIPKDQFESIKDKIETEHY